MLYDQSVYELSKSFLSDDEWFLKLPANLQHLIVDRCAKEVQSTLEDSIEFNKPVFKKYAKPDDTNWAGWYEVDGKTVGHLALDKTFIPVKSQ